MYICSFVFEFLVVSNSNSSLLCVCGLLVVVVRLSIYAYGSCCTHTLVLPQLCIASASDLPATTTPLSSFFGAMVVVCSDIITVGVINQ